MSNRVLRLIVLASFVLGVFGTYTTAFALRPQDPVQTDSLPTITYLGEGPQTFTVEPPLMFLIKTYVNYEFLFVTDPGPTYTAQANEQVWTIDYLPDGPFRLFHEGRNFGNVQAGCVVNYVQIEDNIDNRRNTFSLNGNLLHTIDQGMVTYGTFTIPEDGELTFYAEDSIGLLIQLCPAQVPSDTPETPPAPSNTPETPQVTVTVDVTTTPSLPPTAVQIIPSSTPTTQPTAATQITATTGVETLTPTTPPTAVQVVPSLTPTSQPTANVTNTPGVSPSPTEEPAVNTNTPVPTPDIIPTTGGGPGPREIAVIGSALIALLGLTAVAWWRLLRASRHGG